MQSFERVYLELMEEIGSIESVLDDLYKTRKFLLKSMHSNAPGEIRTSKFDRIGGKANFIPYRLDRIMDKLRQTDEAIALWNECLQLKRKTKSTLDDLMQRMAGLEWKVAFMKDRLHMPLTEIAKKIGYSYNHIKRVSSRLKTRRGATG